MFRHFPSLPGRQLPQVFPAFTHEQLAQVPVRLHRQHGISLGQDTGSDFKMTGTK